MIDLFLVFILFFIYLFFFWGISILFSIMAVWAYIPTNSAGRFPFSTSSPAFIVCRFFWWWLFWLIWGDYLIVVSLFRSLIMSMLSIFSCVCLLWRNVCLGILPIFWLGCLILSSMSYLYIWRLILCQLLHLIFSNSEGCLFILFMFPWLCKSF